MATFPTFSVNFLERLLKFFHARNYLRIGLLGIAVVPGTFSLTGCSSTCRSSVFFVAVTLRSVMHGVCAPMLLAKIAIFFNARVV